MAARTVRRVCQHNGSCVERMNVTFQSQSEVERTEERASVVEDSNQETVSLSLCRAGCVVCESSPL